MEPTVCGSILLGADEFVAQFVAARLGNETRFAGVPLAEASRIHAQTGVVVPSYSSLGVVRRGQFVGGVVYHNFVRMPHGNAVETSIAFDDPSWALPGTLRALCHYPFVTMDCVRVTAIVAKSNKRSRKWVEGFGFKREGVHPRGVDGKQTAISYGLLREDCRWLKERTSGKIGPIAPAAA